MADSTTAPTAGLVLAIDTSIDLRAGLARDGVTLATAGLAETRSHAERLMPVVDELLTRARVGLVDLDGIVVGLGPGPFTGLRVGIATAETLAFAVSVPWTGVCGLDVLAVQWLRERQGASPTSVAGGEFVVATDARRRELYWARYATDGRRLEGPRVSAPGDLPALPVVGPGTRAHPDTLGDRVQPGLDHLDAGLMAARTFPDAGTEPLYLRRPDATEPTRRKSTLPRVLPRIPRPERS